VSLLDPRKVQRSAPALAREPRILEVFAGDLAASGLVGERRAAAILYLAAVSRLLDRPVSVAVKGPSSAGESRDERPLSALAVVIRSRRAGRDGQSFPHREMT
jgi:hypothetical protein